jgi:cob(I)alamin adenosyltransferase
MADERVNTMVDKARILIFTGEGKGKTTAALGMALRACGHGLRVLVIQFVKKADTGEIFAADTMVNIKIVQTGLGFLPEEKNREYDKHKLSAEKGLLLAEESIKSGNFDLIVFDEICFAVDRGLLREKDVIDVMGKADVNMTLVLTGRHAPQEFINLADTVSNIQCVKHGFKTGIAAQKGVEF